MLESLNQIQTIQIGTEFYRLVEVEGEHSRLAWEETFEDENAYQGGTPNILSEPESTWHMGGFKSREGIPGTSEYGVNSDARWPNRLLPGPEQNTIVLTDCAHEPTSFFEALGRLFVCAGRRIYRIDPADDSVTLSKDLGAPYSVIMGLRWDDDQALIGTDTDGGSIFKLTALATPDSWSNDDAEGYRLAAGLDRLFAVSIRGLLKNCLTGLDPLEHDNWADEVQCGDLWSPPTGMVAYERTVLVGKPEGLFGVSEEGKGIPLIKRMAPNDNNCFGMSVLEPSVLVPHPGGLFRFIPGLVESVGIEQEVLNENASLRGYMRAFASSGKWTFAVFESTNATLTFILVFRDAHSGEDSLSPYIWDTLINFPYTCRAIHVSYLWDPPRVFHGISTTSVGWFKLSNAGGAPDPDGSDYRFTQSAVRFTRNFTFGTWRDKDFTKVDLAVRDTSGSRYWVLSYRVDRTGSYSNLDIDGSEMRADSDGLHTFVLPTTAKGREIQYKFTYTGDANTSKAEITHFKPYAVPASLKLRHYNLTLYLAGETRHDGGVEQRTSIDQLNDLYALTESPTGVDCKGPWGDITIHPKRMRMLEARQEGHELPRFLVEFVAQKRETS